MGQERLRDPIDELVGVDALCLCFEARDDAMPQRIMRHAADVIRRDVVTTVEPGYCAAALIERNGAAWTRTVVEPTDEIGLVEIRLPSGHHQLDEVFLDTRGHVLIDDLLARREYIVRVEPNRRGCFTLADSLGAHEAEDRVFCLRTRIVDFHMHQKSIELRFGQGICTFLFDRILRRHHQKQIR